MLTCINKSCHCPTETKPLLSHTLLSAACLVRLKQLQPGAVSEGKVCSAYDSKSCLSRKPEVQYTFKTASLSLQVISLYLRVYEWGFCLGWSQDLPYIKNSSAITVSGLVTMHSLKNV